MSDHVDIATLRAGWDSYRLMVVAVDAPTDQLTEMRRAFYAGAAHLYAVLMKGTDLPHDEAMNQLARFSKELYQFSIDIEGGRA